MKIVCGGDDKDFNQPKSPRRSAKMRKTSHEIGTKQFNIVLKGSEDFVERINQRNAASANNSIICDESNGTETAKLPDSYFDDLIELEEVDCPEEDERAKEEMTKILQAEEVQIEKQVQSDKVIANCDKTKTNSANGIFNKVGSPDLQNMTLAMLLDDKTFSSRKFRKSRMKKVTRPQPQFSNSNSTATSVIATATQPSPLLQDSAGNLYRIVPVPRPFDSNSDGMQDSNSSQSESNEDVVVVYENNNCQQPKQIKVAHPRIKVYHFNCEFCSLSFYRSQALEEHIGTCTKKPYKCHKCPATFSLLSHMGDHMKKTHSKPVSRYGWNTVPVATVIQKVKANNGGISSFEPDSTNPTENDNRMQMSLNDLLNIPVKETKCFGNVVELNLEDEKDSSICLSD